MKTQFRRFSVTTRGWPMPDIETEFKNDEEMKQLRWAAEKRGMTVEEFTTHAANQFVKQSKSDIRKRIQNPDPIQIIK